MLSINKSTALVSLLTFLVVGMAILFSTATPALAAEKLKVVSAWAQNNKMNDALWMLQKKVKEKSNGELEIVWGGGPEAIPAFQLVEALRNGVVDLAWTAHTYNVAQLPVVEGAKLSKLTPAQEREKGVFAFYQEVYQKKAERLLPGKRHSGPHLQSLHHSACQEPCGLQRDEHPRHPCIQGLCGSHGRGSGCNGPG